MNSKNNFWGISTTLDMTKAALVAALYVVLTMLLAAISFNPAQIRFAEGFNNLVVFNKRYFTGVFLGVFIANLLTSPYGLPDVLWGSFSTLVTLLVIRLAIRPFKQLWLRLVISVIVGTVMMFMIALELAFLSKTAFIPTFFADWGSLMVGEFIAMTVGAVIIYILSFAIDFEK